MQQARFRRESVEGSSVRPIRPASRSAYQTQAMLRPGRAQHRPGIASHEQQDDRPPRGTDAGMPPGTKQNGRSSTMPKKGNAQEDSRSSGRDAACGLCSPGRALARTTTRHAGRFSSATSHSCTSTANTNSILQLGVIVSLIGCSTQSQRWLFRSQSARCAPWPRPGGDPRRRSLPCLTRRACGSSSLRPPSAGSGDGQGRAPSCGAGDRRDA